MNLESRLYGDLRNGPGELCPPSCMQARVAVSIDLEYRSGHWRRSRRKYSTPRFPSRHRKLRIKSRVVLSKRLSLSSKTTVDTSVDFFYSAQEMGGIRPNQSIFYLLLVLSCALHARGDTSCPSVCLCQGTIVDCSCGLLTDPPYVPASTTEL